MQKWKLRLSGAVLTLLLAASPVMASSVTYTVEKGDNLWDISRQYHVDVESLMRLNGLDSEALRIGQVLTIIPEQPPLAEPDEAPTATVGDEAEVETEGESPGVSAGYYTVQAGDTLSAIAQAHSMSVSYLKSLNGLADDFLAVGQQLNVEAQEAVDPAAGTVLASRGGERSNAPADDLLSFAAQFIGTPYAYGGSGPGGFDCSGFTSYVFKQFGYSLSRTADGQYGNGTAVSAGDLLPGDLVFFCCRGSKIDHVGIYVGGGEFIHSSSPRSGGVIYTSMKESYYANSYAGAARVL